MQPFAAPSPIAALVHRIAQHGRGQQPPHTPAGPLVFALATLEAGEVLVMRCLGRQQP